MSDFYRTLHVSPRADQATIKAAYRRLASQVHPDVNPGSDATARMTALNEAYAVLRDPARRHAYDRQRLGIILSEATWSPPEPTAYAPTGWDDDGEQIAARAEHWRAVVRAIGTVLALIGIISLLLPGRPLAAHRQPIAPPPITQPASAGNRG
jgi:curved DNA-binding protein CbpA